jgi:hypothetical protein
LSDLVDKLPGGSVVEAQERHTPDGSGEVATRRSPGADRSSGWRKLAPGLIVLLVAVGCLFLHRRERRSALLLGTGIAAVLPAVLALALALVGELGWRRYRQRRGSSPLTVSPEPTPGLEPGTPSLRVKCSTN